MSTQGLANEYSRQLCTDPNSNYGKCLSVDRWISKLWYIHKTDATQQQRRDELLKHNADESQKHDTKPKPLPPPHTHTGMHCVIRLHETPGRTICSIVSESRSLAAARTRGRGAGTGEEGPRGSF